MEDKKTLLSWRSFPLVDEPGKSWVLIIFMLAVSIALYRIAVINWDSPIYFYLGMAFFCGSLINWFIPTRYELFEDKIVIYYWRIKTTREWQDFGCWYADKKGVLLSTFKRPRRLDNFRGQSLRFSKDKAEKDELYRILSDKIGNKY